MNCAKESQPLDSKTIRLIATSDLHGKFVPWDYALDEESRNGSMAQLASAVAHYRTDTTLLLDAGDTIQDNSADIFVGKGIHPMAVAMNAIGYDVWVTGNHDYNYGIDAVKDLSGSLGAKTLVGNVWDADGKPLADGFKLFTIEGIRVVVVGMVTPNIVRWDASNLAGCKVSNPVMECRHILDEIEGRYDLLVGVMHMGIDSEYEVAGSGIADIIAACPEFDVVVAAHTHLRVPGERIDGVLVVENLEQAQTMAVIDVILEPVGERWRPTSLTSDIIDVSSYAPDPTLVKELAQYHQAARDDASVVIGKLVGGSLVPPDEMAGIPEARVTDTSLIDLINRVQMHYTGAQVSATACFRSDANLHVGKIRKCDVSLIYKFANTLYTVEMSGAQLRKFMEWSAAYYNTYEEGDLSISFNPAIPAYNYYMFGGIHYEIDVSEEAGSRIQNLTWPDGRVLREDERLSVAVNNYCAGTVLLVPGVLFEEGDLPKLLEMDVRGDIGGIRELIRDYIAHVMGGMIEPVCDNWWNLTGLHWDKDLRKEAARLLSEGKLAVPASDDGSHENVRPIRTDDILLRCQTTGALPEPPRP